ncbi:Zinc finger CCCH domain-containing protein 37 [Zostera marina]|uniref:Zinc finger CCCH domain-containing protein 37 n=1 Tax=Zostera marina TaxID=29655 RepID=A0A0K9P5E5_ZOSMR|nr:Zinc finger CCCH domain-containing protein 37 [Zostera marina]
MASNQHSKYITAASSSRYTNVAPGTDAYTRYLGEESARYASMDMASSSTLNLGVGTDVGVNAYMRSIWGVPSSVEDGIGAMGPVTDSMLGIKRQVEALYYHNALGTHNSIGHSEALYSTNSFAKRPRVESASLLPIYPQRPGEKDCAHYMLTRTCKFGDTCKFDHPLWVPEGGIPDWKEVPVVSSSDLLPERQGVPDCPYFMKTEKCKFGYSCKFNHPKDKAKTEIIDPSTLPERPTEPICSFYSKTGICKFGANCIFNHPKDLHSLATGSNTNTSVNDAINVPFFPALLHNTKGLPIRPGEQECSFYLKTGSCKYGARCRFNHQDWNVAAGLTGQTMYQIPGAMHSYASLIPGIDPSLTQTLAVVPAVYPHRPHAPPCDYYMKTGACKFGDQCKFHHPVDRSASITYATQISHPAVKLTLAGLPRHEGTIICPFYLKTGTCKYDAACKFDHPPPGELMTMPSNEGAISVDLTKTETS